MVEAAAVLRRTDVEPVMAGATPARGAAGMFWGRADATGLTEPVLTGDVGREAVAKGLAKGESLKRPVSALQPAVTPASKVIPRILSKGVLTPDAYWRCMIDNPDATLTKP